ncbi:unnamed protein product, partial [Mesorhabditis belari]|uniref:Uncharacterized protein n=1 Tax=Mesorhabditis belari TaxID=2138241 RepID=A0AAF3E969_9BILA
MKISTFFPCFFSKPFSLSFRAKLKKKPSNNELSLNGSEQILKRRDFDSRFLGIATNGLCPVMFFIHLCAGVTVKDSEKFEVACFRPSRQTDSFFGG